MAKKKPAPEVADGDEKGAKKKSKKKLLAVPLLLVLVVGGYVYMGMGKKPAAAAAGGGPPTTVAGMIVEETSQTVNLRDDHYLEYTAALDVAPGGKAAILTTDQAVLLDLLDTQCSAMTETELLAVGGQARLKANILKALGQEWPNLVTGIYFEQFVMQ